MLVKREWVVMKVLNSRVGGIPSQLVIRNE